MTDFGERVDLTANLASILRRYPFSTGLFREILQNSDDAHATKQVFVLDRRQFGTNTLINGKLAGIQGPAFLAYNDAVFSDADWEAIRTVSQSSKTADSEKIGKHGLGSRAYYHLTDNPQYLSGGHLAIFDPHRWAFEHGGWKQSLEEVASQHPDQLEPFESLLRNQSRENFPGTIVRLALRGALSESRISSKRVSADEIHDLLVEFIKQELDIAMLFLSHLTLVEVKEIGVDGREQTLASATASSRSLEVLKSFDPAMTFTLSSRAITATSVVSSSTTCDWLIARALCPKDEFIDLLCKSLGASREWVAGEVEREKLRSDVALAFPTKSSHTMCGRLFTYLPLPLTTGFPCHIHSVFSLTDSRQNLRNPSETIMRQTADALAVAWNRLLFETLIPRTWLTLLESVAAGPASLSVYNCLPPLQDRNTSGDATYWTSLLGDVVQLAHSRNACIWPLCTGSGDSPQTTNYASLTDVFIAGTQDEEQLRALANAGLNIVLPSPSLRGVLLETCPSRELTPHSARPALVRSQSLRGLPQLQKDLIVEFLLGSRDVCELVDVPVFQLVSGTSTALEAKWAGLQEVHVLLDETAAGLFGHFDPNAINLRHVPAVARTLLVNNGSKHLNVRPLDSSQCIAYIQAAQANFSSPQRARSPDGTGGWLSKFWRSTETSSGGAWSWDRTVKWLVGFWAWVETCSFVDALRPDLKRLHLMPTVTREVRSVEDQVFSQSSALADSVRALSGLGVHILDPRIPSKFFDRQTPKFTKSLSSASDLLTVLGAISVPDVDDAIADILRAHLAGLMDVVRLNKTQKATLRELPIHLVLTAGAPTSARRCLPANDTLRCVVNPASIALPLPSLLDTTFVHCTADERQLIEKLDYDAVARPLTTERILQLHVNNFTKQTPEARLIVLTYLIDHQSILTSSMRAQLQSSPIVRVDRGTRLLAPKDVVDPASSIAGIVPPWDTSAIFSDNGINSETTSALASLRLLRQDLDVEYVKARIIRVAEFPALSEQGLELARMLFSTMDRTWFDYCNVRYDRDLAWIPTNEGLRRPRDCRDEMHSMLCDRVMPILDTGMVQSTFLRKMLGWDEPVPLDIVVTQFRKILSEPQSSSRSECLDVLTAEFGRRFKEATSAQLDDIAVVARQAPWVLTSTGELQLPAFAVFTLRERLRGFGQISLELARRAGVTEFLTHMGCNLSPTNDAIIHQLHQLLMLQASEPSPQVTHDCVQLLQALHLPSLTASQREKLLAPGIDSRLHETQGMYYNDLGSRAFHLESPSDRIQAHHAMPHDLCAALQISSLGSLHLQPLELDIESMREDLTTRIGNVLRSYDIDQAFNEFLANAADAGAKKFNIMLDYGDDRRADPSEVLCQNMAQFCRGPAVIAHNDAEFTMDDIRGICRIGRGGKEDREGTVGRFGLGALSFYHFSEVAMILSGSYILLLDPSGGYLPEESRANSYVVSLDKMRGLYPGHLKLFHNLFGFQSEHCTHYNGTIIRLALRTKSQASKSTLSNRSISTNDVRDMVDRYHANAARSLFFIGVQEITALETKPGRAAPTTKWSVIAQREGLHSDDENDNPSLLNIRTDRPFAFPSSWKSSWLVVNTVIPPEHLPDRLRSVVGRHRVKQLSIALATRTSPRTVSRDDHASHFHFFSSLPLPIPTSLPLHVHASFILADDRRNIRWDGDGTLTPDSECNHWLLSTALPPLYLRAIEMLNERFAEVPTPWPGNMDRFPDPISKALVDAFYSEQHLSVSPRRVFRTISGHLLDPSVAVVRAHMPSTVRDLLHQLCPDALVELPRSVRSRVIATQSIHHTSPQYVHDAIASSRERFLAVCGNNIHTTCELVQGVIQHMLLDEPKVSIPPASLHGLPLLALADGTLADIEAEGQQADHIYVGPWGRNQPWPLFPATRFLDPSMDQRLFLDKGWNVSPWDESASIIALLRKEIPEGAQREVSEPERKWITMFWRFFDSAADKSKLLSVLNLFPLIPTIDERVFVSLARATNLPAILPPRASALSDARVLDPLQKIGVLIVNLNINLESKSGHDRVSELLPQTVQGRLALVEFTFTRVLQTLHHLNQDGDIETKFQKLPDDELTRLTSWLRESLKNTHLPASLGKLKKRQGFVNVLRYLPIWPAFRSSGPSVFKSLSASNVRLLPQHARPANSITPFLLADPSLFFIEYSKDISRLPQVIQPMSLVNLSRQLKFPSSFSSLNMLLPYKTLLDVALKLGGELLNSLQVPNNNLELMAVRSMFKSDVPEFAAAFTHKAGKMFVHPQLRSYEPRLVASGLRNKLTFENFKECVAAIHQDFDKEDPRDHDRCLVIYEWYTTRLPLSIASTGHWRQLDPYSFIPTRRSRRLGDAASFDETAFAQHLPLIVSPNNILRDEYSAVAWSQRALFHDTPSRRLFMADESLGIPTTEEVVKHLHVLATKIASQHPRDAGLVSDLQATYQYLQEHHGEAKKFLLRHRTEALFLNVDDPRTAKSWEFLPASQIMFNLSNEHDDIDVDREVRAFLRPFRDLLLASGANEIKIPLAPSIPASSAEAYLSSFRASIVEQRRSKVLTDVVFRVTGAPGTEGDSDSDLWAHRALLATASEHFRRLFCGQSGFAESGAASAENPVVINLEDDLELRCVGLVLDHVYTGRFEESQDRECLLELMHLAHRWELAAVQAKAEALLVRTITTGAYREMREHAEQINASCLLEKIEEFERENAFVLKGL